MRARPTGLFRVARTVQRIRMIMRMLHRRRLEIWIAALAVALAVGGCAQPSAGRDDIEVKLQDREGRSVGTARLRDTSHGVLVHAELSGIPPGDHAFHIHETGKCEAPFTSAGGHVHKAGTKHGFANPEGFHAGDLPNVHVPESGRATVEAFATGVRLTEGDTPLIDADGSALILHASADDYHTDPAGSAGDRIACGVIK